jgi:Protein of unknown function (DUF1569)
MKTLFDPVVVTEVKQRMAALQPGTVALWGKMTAAQALAHCGYAMETATGDKQLPRVFIGRVLGPLFKSIYSNEKPLSRNSPTDKNLIVGDHRDLEHEKARLSELIDRFSDGGFEGCTRHPHSFFGRLSPLEWGTGMYKHLDHHLRQFRV